MDLDHSDGRLKIHYSDRLCNLVREVRQLVALGFTVPAAIQQAANTAEKFYRQAMVLKQVSLSGYLIRALICFFNHLSCMHAGGPFLQYH